MQVTLANTGGHRDARTVLNSLLPIAMGIARTNNIEVVFDTNIRTGKTDGKTIVLGAIPVPTPKAKEKELQDLATFYYGLLDHELMHVRETQFDVPGLAESSQFTRDICNSIEDCRGENAHAKNYPGADVNMKALSVLLLEKGLEGPIDSDTPPGAAIDAYVNQLLQFAYRGVSEYQQMVDQSEETLRTIVGDAAVDRTKALLVDVPRLQDTRGAFVLAQEIVKAINEEADKAQQKASQQNTQSQAQSGSGAGQQGNGQPDPNDPSQNSANGQVSQSDPSSPNQNAASGTAGDGAGQQSSQDQASTSVSASDPQGQAPLDAGTKPLQVQAQADALQRALQTADGDGKQDRSDAIREHLSEAVNQLERSGKVSALVVPNCVQANLAGEKVDLSEIIGISARARTKLMSVLDATTREHVRHTTRGHRVDTRVLHRTGTGDGNIFLVRDDAVGVNTAFMVLLDVSVSMKGLRIEMARKACLCMAMAAEPIKGVRVAVSTFPCFQVLLPFGVSARRNSEKLMVSAVGSHTPTAQGLMFAGSHLLRQRETRKVMVVITDGQADDAAHACAARAKLESHGVEVYGIGIGLSLERTIPQSQTLSDVAALPSLLMSLLHQGTTRGILGQAA